MNKPFEWHSTIPGHSRHANLHSLEMASSLGHFLIKVNSLDGPERILDEIHRRVRNFIKFRQIGIFLVDESTADFELKFHYPPAAPERLEKEVARLISDRTFAWAMGRNRPTVVRDSGGRDQIMLHVIATASRIRGMFVGMLDQEKKDIPDESLALLTNILLGAASSLESYELYRRIRDYSEELEKTIERLEDSQKKLIEHQNRLESRIERRTQDLARSNEELRREVQERRKAEEIILSTLAEKEILLKEIHHRVKNNMQVISSLLSLQAGQTSEPAVKAVLQDSHNRILSMALIHESLYGSGNLAEIDIGEYIELLYRRLKGTMSGLTGQVRLIVDAEIPALTMAEAVPFGLILNELLTNALKHAFSRQPEGTLRVVARQVEDGWNELSVWDDGPGLPENIEALTSGSLGLKLVALLAEKQLGGTWMAANENGARFTIRWPRRIPGPD